MGGIGELLLPMAMTNEQFVDCHVDDLRDNKLPALLTKHPGAIAFLREFGAVATAIVATAAMLGPEVEAYAKGRVAEVLLERGALPAVRPVE